MKRPQKFDTLADIDRAFHPETSSGQALTPNNKKITK